MKALRILALVCGAVLLMSTPAMAQETGTGTYVFSGGGVGFGIALAGTMLGAGLGFGRIGAVAFESMARQPEVAGTINGGMIIVAALLEGATLFSVLVCLLAQGGFGNL